MTTNNTKEVFGLGKQKVLEEFSPNKKYITVTITSITLLFIVSIGIIYALALIILGENYGWRSADFTRILLLVTYIGLGSGLLAYIIAIICVFPYYHSINYTFTTQEVIVNKGFLVKRTKIVPFRNITNFVMRRGILDRLIGGNDFGTISIETAGQGPNQSHPEQRLVGIANIAEYTEKIRGILAKMKGQAGITADLETASSLDDEVLLLNILETLKEIKEKL